MRPALRTALKVFLLVAILGAAGLSAHIRSRAIVSIPKSAGPIWEVDLTKYGFQGRPPIPLRNEDSWGFATYQQGVVFTENNVVVAFFVVHDSPTGAPADRKSLPSDSYRLVAVFLNAKSGELIQKHEWPVPSSTRDVALPYLFPTTDGRFIAGNQGGFSLYSRDLQTLAKYSASAPGVEVGLVVSPAGDTLLTHEVERKEGVWISRFALLDASQLSTVASWQESPPRDAMVAGNEIAWRTRGTLHLKTPETAARALFASNDLYGYSGFINKDVIAVGESGSSKRLLLVSTTNGRSIAEIAFGSDDMDGPLVASQNGRRFAIPLRHWGLGNNNPKKLMARVYDVGNAQPILALDVTPHYTSDKNFDTPGGDTRFGWGGLALSPDGELLAVKSGAIVQLYPLPELGRPGECAAPCAKAGDPANEPPANAQPAAAVAEPWLPTPAPQPMGPLVQQALFWLPADTETVTAANGVFPLPELNENKSDDEKKLESDEDIAGLFRLPAVGIFGFHEGMFEKDFKGANIELAIEGARHFRSPAGLGGAPYAGADILVFSSDVTTSANSFLKTAPKSALRMEQIDGETVAVFQEKMEDDTWTTYVTFPKPNVAVAATDREYLREVLARIRGKHGPRALPDDLPEWKHVDTHAAFWAVRHYDRRGAQTDPTSPFGGKKTANEGDEKAVGLTFSFDPRQSRFATVTYFSGGKNVPAEFFAQMKRERGVEELQAQYREIEPGVFEGRYNLASDESAWIFSFVLLALLGHAIYV